MKLIPIGVTHHYNIEDDEGNPVFLDKEQLDELAKEGLISEDVMAFDGTQLSIYTKENFTTGDLVNKLLKIEALISGDEQ